MDLKLNNKNALVCGSTQGIGRATAIALAAEGVNVTLVARNREKLKEVLAELPQHRNHSYIVADFSNPRELQEQLIKFIEKEHGFHIVINNTGGPRSGGILTASLEAFENAKRMEKTALDNGSPFTWCQAESLIELSKPERVAQIKADHQKKIEAAAKKRKINPLRPDDGKVDFDEIYGNQKVCLACHK